MRVIIKHSFLGVILASVIPCTLSAQDTAQRGDLGLLAAKLFRASQGHVGSVAETAAAIVANTLAKDIDGTLGLQLSDFDLEWKVYLAERRSGAVFGKLAMDIDGDLILSYPEMRVFADREASRPLEIDGLLLVPSEEQRKIVFARFISELTKYDINKDGSLSGIEISASASQKLPRNDDAELGPTLISWADINDDETVSAEELTVFAAALVNAGDFNKDGQISRSEFNDLAHNQKPLDTSGFPLEVLLPKSSSPDVIEAGPTEEVTPPIADCHVGTVLPGAELVAVGGYEGAGQSDILIGDARDVGTVADVVVPEGQLPIHLLVQFTRPVILRLSGQTDRVRAITSLGAPLGFVGVRKEQLSFLEDLFSECHFEPSRKAGEQIERQKQLLVSAMGEAPLSMIAEYTIGMAELAQGTNVNTDLLPGAINPGYADAAGVVWRRMLLFNPGGLIEIDPSTIVSFAKIEKAATWPGAAGIAKLLADGVITSPGFVNAATEVREFEPGVVRLGGKSFVPGLGDRLIMFDGRDFMQEKPSVWIGRPRPVYIVNRKFTFPPGMNTVAFATFLVPKDVPVPDGDPGGSEVKYKPD